MLISSGSGKVVWFFDRSTQLPELEVELNVVDWAADPHSVYLLKQELLCSNCECADLQFFGAVRFDLYVRLNHSVEFCGVVKYS